MRSHPGTVAGCLLLAASSVAATPRDRTIPGDSTAVANAFRNYTNIEPCARVSNAVANGKSQVPAELAYQCLQSVPLDREGDIQLIDEISVYFEWQSNQAWLANPPAHYDNPKLDIVEELISIRQKLADQLYQSEYEFALDLSDLTLRSQDNHFTYTPDILGAFTFLREIQLVSVSADGHSLPQVYAYGDILPLNGTHAAVNRSFVTHINGMDVETYLNTLPPFRDNGQWHDADARYNSLFPSQVAIQQGSDTPSFTQEYHYVGPQTVLRFANGTTRNVNNVATITKDFTGVHDGASFFKKFCSGPSTDNGTAPPDPGLPGEPAKVDFPSPVVEGHKANAYHLDGMSDTIILSVPTFDTSGDIVSFQKTIEEVIAYSENHNISKLVIDLRNNGGGDVFAGYALFKQLFPSLQPYGSSRLRATDTLNQIGLTAGRVFNVTDPNSLNPADDALLALMQWAFQQYLDLDSKAYTSWRSLFGPHEVYGDQVTSQMLYNISEPAAIDQVNLTAYIDPHSPRGAHPFASENVVLIQDGACSSTCTVFAEMAKTQAHVKAIAMGGRPRYGPMQAIGGTKGSQVIDFDDIHKAAAAAFEKSDNATQQRMAADSKFSVLVRGGKPLERSTTHTLNLRDNIRKGDTTQTPLEVVYEAADCRLFYTAEMLLDVRQVWKRVAEAQWGAHGSNGTSPLCVLGSTGHPSAVAREGVPWGVEQPGSGCANSTHSTLSGTPTGTLKPLYPTTGASYPSTGPSASLVKPSYALTTPSLYSESKTSPSSPTKKASGVPTQFTGAAGTVKTASTGLVLGLLLAVMF